MTGTKQREWHEADRSGRGGMTVRQTGPHFQAIRAWAVRNDVTGIFDAISLAFGFTENFTLVADLCRLLAGNDAQVVLSQWADNPYIAELTWRSPAAALSQPKWVSIQARIFRLRP